MMLNVGVVRFSLVYVFVSAACLRACVYCQVGSYIFRHHLCCDASIRASKHANRWLQCMSWRLYKHLSSIFKSTFVSIEIEIEHSVYVDQW